MIGLEVADAWVRMGANIVRRIMRDGHSAVVYDTDPAAVADLVKDGAVGASSIKEFVEKLDRPRNAWIMVPAGKITDAVIKEVADALEEGDTIIDGGNSYYRDDIRHANALREKGIHFIDCGTSGGVWGLERGYCPMIGGEDAQVDNLNPIWTSIAPGPGYIERTVGRTGPYTPEEQGWLHCGPNGAGHFVKMVHNGIEYAIMSAYAEDSTSSRTLMLAKRSAIRMLRPLRFEHPEFYQYDMDLTKISRSVAPWFSRRFVATDLTAIALLSHQRSMSSVDASQTLEGRWTSIAAIEEGVPADVLTASLYARFQSQGNGAFANKIQSAPTGKQSAGTTRRRTNSSRCCSI